MAKSALKLKWKKEPGMSGIQAPISHGGKDHDYVISHRTDNHTVSFRPPGKHEHVGSFPTEKEAKAAAEAHTRSASQKKSPAQLQREIDDVLAGGTAKEKSPVHHAKKKQPLRVAYRLQLAPSELRAVEFAQGRYAWPDMLSAHATEGGLVAFTEPDMWQWTDDVDSDAEGGHSPFPLASDAFAEKLQLFYDERI